MTAAGVTTSAGASAPAAGAAAPVSNAGFQVDDTDLADLVARTVGSVAALGPRPTETTTIRPAVAALLARPAGLGLVAAVEHLTALGPKALTAAEQVDLVAAAHRCTHRLDALALDATAALSTTVWDDARRERDASEAGRDGDDGSYGDGSSRSDDRWSQLGGQVAVANHLAPALRLAPATASKQVALARVATRDVPTALTAMRAGAMSAAHLRTLIGATRTCSDTVRAAAETAAIAWAASCTRQQVATRLIQLVAHADPDAHAKAVEDGISRCDVRLGSSPHAGCARMIADVPVTDAYAAFAALDAMPRRATAAGTAPAVDAPWGACGRMR